MRQDKRTLQQWKDLAERYFEAETTSAEEHELAQFLATSASQDKEFDELRAVMSYMATGRNYCRTRRRNTIVYAAAAIITGILFTVTAWQFSERRNICVAYIYGERCIDKETVLTEAMKSIEKVRPGSQEENILHNQLSDIFQTLEENDTLSTTN
ncbi:hypothetical protein [uncultured Phocaeicola sp.]|uniref:hypothetical protein n=1 Tax=uncultured Phocaeicola sp. TaxID=990718 RepID=UPI0025D7C3A7|nr:hypothetical protein [uncultured Phocaeicola sp.]